MLLTNFDDIRFHSYYCSVKCITAYDVNYFYSNCYFYENEI